MFVYNLIFYPIIIGLILSILSNKNKTKLKYLFFFSAATIILTVALRADTMGPDTYNYLDYFMRPHSKVTYYQKNNVEPGITILNDLLRIFKANRYIYSFIISSLSLFPIMHLIYKYSANRIMSLFLFISFSVGASLFILSFSMLRQFLALGILALILNRYLDNNRKIDKWIIILFILMSCFHVSSLITILLFILDKVKLSKSFYYISSIASALVGFAIGEFLPTLRTLAIAMNKEFYLTTSTENYSYSIIPLLPYIGILIAMIYLLSLKSCNHLFIKGFYLAVIIGNIMNFGNNVERICAYFYLVSLLAIPYFFSRIKDEKTYYWVILICLISYYSYKYWLVINQMEGSWDITPYKSFI